MKGILLVVLSFFMFLPSVYAQEELKIDPLREVPTVTPEIAYDLPYPGLLPDNPLYPIKASRDRIISFFIADPLKKAEFDLLQADKRIQAGIFLLNKEKPNNNLAITTISKGQNYLEESLRVFEKTKRDDIASQQNKQASPTSLALSDLPDKLVNASQKHTEVLQKKAGSLPSSQQKEFRQLIERSRQLTVRAESIRNLDY